MTARFSRTLLCAAALGLAAPLFAQEPADVNYEQKREDSEMDALRRWLNDKRLITIRELGGDLSISGDVRTEFQATNERRGVIKQRGIGGATAQPAYAWDSDVSLNIDYRTDYTWASVKIKFDNDMGVNGGSVNRIKVPKAYLGGRMVSGDTITLDMEIGRRSLSSVYDSKVQFAALYDGIAMRLGKAFEDIGDFFFNCGPFLIDEKNNHYGAVAEIGMLRVGNVGFNTKYSVINWKRHFSNPQKNDRYNFVVQQLLASYQFNPKWLNKKLIKFYGAMLSNLVADDLVLPNPTTNSDQNLGTQNWGFYAGLLLGTVKKAYDWAIDINFQWVQAQTVADYDFMGIGRGNAARVGLYNDKLDGSGTIPANTDTAVGPCNYYGFEVDMLYAFTDNLTVQQHFKWSRTLDEQIGPDLKYQQFEVEFIYAY